MGFSEVIAEAQAYSDQERIAAKEAKIHAYGHIPDTIEPEKITRQAKLCLTLEAFVDRFDCQASTVQCWDSVENNYGCAACLAMAMIGDAGRPSACESDVTGAVSMLAARLAAQSAPTLMFVPTVLAPSVCFGLRAPLPAACARAACYPAQSIGPATA